MSDFLEGQIYANSLSNPVLRRQRQRTDEAVESSWYWHDEAQRLKAQLDRAVAEAQGLRARLADAELRADRGNFHAGAANELIRELRDHVAELAPQDPLGRVDVVRAKFRQRRDRMAEEAGYVVVDSENFKMVRDRDA